MRRPIFILILATGLVPGAYAQKGTFTLIAGAEAAIPGASYYTGFGGFVKGLYDWGATGQLTLTAGVSKWRTKSTAEHQKSYVRTIPVLAGYRQRMGNFYLEPQAGYGEYGGRISFSGDYARPSNAAFFWALGAGYRVKHLDAGIRYQSAHGPQDYWLPRSFHYTGVYAGYVF